MLFAVEPAKQLRLVILDACRDNPFAKTMKRTLASRAIGRGLAKVEPTSPNTLIAFAAKAGSTASTATARTARSPTALSKHLPKPGLDLRRAFGFVRDDVLKTTGNKQEPYVYGSLGGDDVPLVPAREAGRAGRSAGPIRRPLSVAITSSRCSLARATLGSLPRAISRRLLCRSCKANWRRSRPKRTLSPLREGPVGGAGKGATRAEGAKAQQAKAAAAAKAAEEARIAAEKAKQAEQEQAAAAEQKRIDAEKTAADSKVAAVAPAAKPENARSHCATAQAPLRPTSTSRCTPTRAWSWLPQRGRRWQLEYGIAAFAGTVQPLCRTVSNTGLPASDRRA